ncbi:MAG: hypothetical protein JST68_30620 [Bacteroidetes bacterium]|nr:hypothetical protein [Bacteroidota bacterium]
MKKYYLILAGLIAFYGGGVSAQPPVRLNPLSATLKNEVTQLRQGTYSVVSLQLPGSTKPSDYYVKRTANTLLLNGDIVVYDFTVKSIMSYSRNDDTHTFGKDDLYRWPNGTVPVQLDNSVFQSNYYLIIKSAIDFFNFNTGIVFKEHTNESEWLVITCVDDDGSGKGGSTEVGRQRNGSNILRLTKGKFDKGTVLHELMHTLGFFHEQARPDRDNYISIQWDNIPSGNSKDFQMEDDGTAHGAYDYCSIMQYPAMAFAVDKTKPTITCRTNGVFTACPACMGVQAALTQTDLNGLDELYRGIGISRFPCQIPFVSARVPIQGCVGVSDDSIRAKWDYYRGALGDCQSGQVTLALFGTNYVTFEHGQVYHSPHGVHAIYGDIYQLFVSTNGMGGHGLPMTDESDINDAKKGLSSWVKAGYTRFNRFEKDVIVWGPVKKARVLTTEQFNAGPNPLASPVIRKDAIIKKVTP